MNDDLEIENNPNKKNIPKGKGLNAKKMSLFFAFFLIIVFVVMFAVVHYHQKSTEQSVETGAVHYKKNKGTIQSTDAINELNQQHLGALNQKQQKSVVSMNVKNLTQNKERQEKQNNEVKQLQFNANESMMTDDRSRLLIQAAQSSINVIHHVQVNQNTSLKPALTELPSFPTSLDHDQNQQAEKVAFLKKIAHKKSNNMIGSTIDKPVSPYEIQAGALIPAILITGVNSDLPGQITASVSDNVYDSTTGNFLLIPQGTKLIGIYDSSIAFGQNRVLIAWSRLLFPNGTSFDLEGMPGVDLSGMSGLHDLTDNHYGRIFGSALMFSLFGAAGQLSQPQTNNNNTLTNQQIVWGAIGQQMSQTGAQLVQKNINIQPTIKIRPGASFNVLLTKDMVLPAPYRFYNDEGNEE